MEMANVEVYSWWFVHKEWDKLKRMPIPDKGFEESFREYLYKKINFDIVSDVRETKFGLSYSTMSTIPHELDVICIKKPDKFIFELKHYGVSNITKEIIFTFLGKVMDFYLKNVEFLPDYKVSMFLVTINKNIDDSVRKLCIAYGIKLIEPSLMTLETLDYFSRDLYQKIPEKNIELKEKAEKLVESISELKENHDYSFSDIFRYKDGKIEIDLPLQEINPTETLNKIKEYYNLFEEVKQAWKKERN
jgi:hypothetical protein